MMGGAMSMMWPGMGGMRDMDGKAAGGTGPRNVADLDLDDLRGLAKDLRAELDLQHESVKALLVQRNAKDKRIAELEADLTEKSDWISPGKELDLLIGSRIAARVRAFEDAAQLLGDRAATLRAAGSRGVEMVWGTSMTSPGMGGKADAGAAVPRGLADRGPADIAAMEKMLTAIKESYEIYGAELATAKDNADYLELRAKAQSSVRETELVAEVQEVLARYRVQLIQIPLEGRQAELARIHAKLVQFQLDKIWRHDKP